MTNLQELRKDLENIKIIIERSKDEEYAIKQEIAKNLAEFKIGTVVEDDRGYKFQITDLSLHWGEGRTEYHAVKINKDGSHRKGGSTVMYCDFKASREG